ncbi:MAG: lipopolysaccharide kinase InaA family protein, partial [Burkholderiales bacterium]
ALVRQMRRLEERGFAHRDCKAANVLVITQPRLKLLWIDLDGLRLVGKVNPNQRLQALMRLHVSLLDVPGLTRSDRVRFLKAYFARFGADRRAWRAAWRSLSAAAEQKIRAKRARREWKLAHYGRE